MHARPRKKHKTFRFTIRLKLLLVTSTIVITALSVMILMATRFFREHSQTLIQEYNLSLAQLIGARVEADLEDLARQARLMASLLEESSLSRQRVEHYAASFFQENQHCVFLGIAARPTAEGAGSFALRHALSNRNTDLPGVRLVDLITTDPDRFTQSFAGATLVHNLTLTTAPDGENGVALLAVSLPLIRAVAGATDNDSRADGADREILIAIIQSGPLLEAFHRSGQTALFDIFMVDGQGHMIAHSRQAGGAAPAPDGRPLPIVVSLLQNGSANGSQKFTSEGVEYLGSYRTLDFGRLSIVSTIEADRAFEAVYRIQKQNLKIMAIVLILAFLIVFFFSRTLSRPISRLVRATRQIEQGDYNVTIRPSTHDEVGLLTQSFARMAAGLEERERIKKTFGKFVNPEIVKRALAGELKLGGEHKVSAVLFSDLRNFTAMAETLRPDEVVAILNDYFTHMVECVHARYGVVDKFIGDAIMAHWGAVVSNGNDTENAVHAAIDMRNALSHVNENLGLRGDARLQIGCGINTGPVLAGQIGSETRLEYTVIGDTVNLASRIEYLNKQFGTDILISEYAHRMVEGTFHVVEMPPIRIKGKSRAETVYAVLGRVNDDDCPASLAELRDQVGIVYDPESVRRHMEASSDQLVNGGALFGSSPKPDVTSIARE